MEDTTTTNEAPPADATAATTPCIPLPAEINMSSVVEVKALLDEALAGLTDRVGIDAGSVTVVDTAGVQLLRSFLIELEVRSVKIEYVRTSDALAAALTDSGWTGGF